MVLASISPLVQYILVVAALQVSQVSTQAGPSHANSICLQIANAVSDNTNVYFSGEPNYEHDIAHYAGSSTQESLCSVEPGNPTDVGKILKLVGQTRTPFAVKSGGHIMNPGFSSTRGVHISMTRFSEVTYDSKSQTAVVGAGLVWDDVYAALEPHKVSVGGGRAGGIGVGGFALGGGYSWHANQHGLTIDMITAFELVKPTGRVTTVTEASDSDLFFGLKGGFNNFGIVTRFTFRVFPQGPVWGGIAFYNSSQVAAVLDAAVRFSTNNTDPKANIITSVNYVPGFVQAPFASTVMFYDGPNPPSGHFDQFMSIPAFQSNVSTRSLLSLIQSVGAGAPPVLRGVYGAAPIRRNSPNIVKAVLKEIDTWSTKLAHKSGTEILYAFEPFLPTVLSHNNLSTAYPPSRDAVYLPMNIWFQWNDTKDDAVMTNAVRQTTNNILEAAERDGQDLRKASSYPNYAIWGTKLEDMYGENVPKLRSLKRRVDPENIMGLAGGWKF